MGGIVNRLLASQGLLLANRIAPIISASLLGAWVFFNGKTVKDVPPEQAPKFQLSSLEKWRATTWI